jgi:hypothetical protein
LASYSLKAANHADDVDTVGLGDSGYGLAIGPALVKECRSVPSAKVSSREVSTSITNPAAGTAATVTERPRRIGENNQNSRCKNPKHTLTTTQAIKTLSIAISAMVIASPSRAIAPARAR